MVILTVKRLVARGADINIADNDGYRPLHLLVLNCPDGRYILGTFVNSNDLKKILWNTVKFLVEQGVDIHSRNSDGDTAAVLAEKSDNYHLLHFLEPRKTKKRVLLVFNH